MLTTQCSFVQEFGLAVDATTSNAKTPSPALAGIAGVLSALRSPVGGKKLPAYCHRSGNAFVREAPGGFVLMENRHQATMGCRKCAQELLQMFKESLASAEMVCALMDELVAVAAEAAHKRSEAARA
jgi:hypothetical protein